MRMITSTCPTARKYEQHRLTLHEESYNASKRIKKAHDVNIAESVRRLHNSENNPHKYVPQTRINSSHNSSKR
ncbi:hypothetical protein F2P79_010261 [Pimephales promelas]|nr:hypothetical protein F2P79_010261 [Pimephales promelas]